MKKGLWRSSGARLLSVVYISLPCLGQNSRIAEYLGYVFSSAPTLNLVQSWRLAIIVPTGCKGGFHVLHERKARVLDLLVCCVSKSLVDYVNKFFHRVRPIFALYRLDRGKDSLVFPLMNGMQKAIREILFCAVKMGFRQSLVSSSVPSRTARNRVDNEMPVASAVSR